MTTPYRLPNSAGIIRNHCVKRTMERSTKKISCSESYPRDCLYKTSTLGEEDILAINKLLLSTALKANDVWLFFG